MTDDLKSGGKRESKIMSRIFVGRVIVLKDIKERHAGTTWSAFTTVFEAYCFPLPSKCLVFDFKKLMTEEDLAFNTKALSIV